MAIPAIIGAVAGIGSAAIGSSASSSAADSAAEASDRATEAQLQAQREALAYYEQQYGLNREVLSPYFNIDPSQWASDATADIDQQIEDLKAARIGEGGTYSESRPVRGEDYAWGSDSGRPLTGFARLLSTAFSRTRESDEDYQQRLDDWNTGKAEWEESLLVPDEDYAAQLAELEAQRQAILDDPTLAMPQTPFHQQLAMTGVLGSEAEQRSIEGLMDSPTSQYLQQQGNQSINRYASATGGLGGSERLKQLSEFNQNITNQVMQNRFNQLGALTGVGLQASQALAGIGSSSAAGQAQIAQNTGNALSNISMAGGQAAAQNALNQGQIWGNLFGDLGGMAAGYAASSMAPQTYNLQGGLQASYTPGANAAYLTSAPWL